MRDLGATSDTLTGLANRRQLETMLDVQLAEAARSGQPISCLMVDVDHFKRFNDSFGHDAGDAVLREVGAVLDHVTREGGLACRYGGEEFVLLMPGFGPDQALERAEDVRRRVEALRVTHNGQDLGLTTVSLGLASAPDHCGLDRLVETADAAMYRAKGAGRNQVAVAVARRPGRAVA